MATGHTETTKWTKDTSAASRAVTIQQRTFPAVHSRVGYLWFQSGGYRVIAVKRVCKPAPICVHGAACVANVSRPAGRGSTHSLGLDGDGHQFLDESVEQPPLVVQSKRPIVTREQ